MTMNQRLFDRWAVYAGQRGFDVAYISATALTLCSRSSTNRVVIHFSIIPNNVGTNWYLQADLRELLRVDRLFAADIQLGPLPTKYLMTALSRMEERLRARGATV